jgi:hypothetical protein
MPVITPGAKRELGVINAQTTDPRGERTQFFFDTEKGIPRRDDLGTVRMLEKTHPVSLPLGTIKTQVSTTDWVIRPTVDDPSEKHEEAAAEIEEFLKGNYNSNGDPFDHLTKQWAHDIISLDTGIIEKVPGENGYLRELYNRDGAVFTKSLNRHDQLPEPPEAAYWQFQFSGAMEPFDPSRSLHEMAEEFGGAFPYMQRRGEPIGFSREQLVWTETNPAPWRHYGFGKVQQARRIAEIILNQDTSNLSYFAKNEVPDGVVNVIEANQDEIEDFRQYWKDEVKGQEHVLPVVGGAGSQIEWIPFRPTPDELEFMASQKWYHQLVWMVFGLNQGEVGDIENINRATMKEQAANVFRTTTKPLLDRMENDLNRHVLAFMEPYHRVGGELEFAWQIDNPAMKERERQRQKEDLESGTKTVNEIRQERGEDALDWGNMPLELMRSVARNHPGWALEKWAEVDDAPSPAPGGGLLSAYGGSSGTNNEADSGNRNRGAEEAPRSFDRLPSSESLSFADVYPLKDDGSLRDEPYKFQYPPLVGHAEGTEAEIESGIKGYEDDLLAIAEEHFPEEEPPTEFGHRPAMDDDLADFASALSGTLSGIVVQRNIEAMGLSAEYHAQKLEEEAEKAFSQKNDEEVAIEIEFDVEDTFASERMEAEAAQRMVTVSNTVKETVRRTLTEVAEDGGNVTEATSRLKDVLDTNIPNHARLVARTETRMSQSAGSQALAESSDLIEGKEWNATDDGRTRSWHEAMDGEIVRKEDSFLVPSVTTDPDETQPSDYPREAFTVGDDQPFNCRCVQEPVLAEDMPDDLKALNAMAGVKAFSVPKDSDRMREVIKEVGSPGDALSDVLGMALEQAGSKNAACELLSISTATLYDWGKTVGMPEFAT